MQAGKGTVKRSRPSVDDESPGCFESLVLEELEDVVFQVRSVRRNENNVFPEKSSPLCTCLKLRNVAGLKLTKKTRICFRDALFRLAETSSKARCGDANGSGRQSVHQAAEGNASR